jgi:CDP-diacylglycerol--glycerol-3-phosphate 3-phosphatidyltransferase
MGYKEVRDSLKDLSQKILVPVVVLLNKTGATPNFVTWLGFLLNLPAVYFIIKGKFAIAAVIIIVAGVFDMLDGALARIMDKKTKFGGFLDSTVDRFVEGVLYFGLLVYYIETNDKLGILLSYTVLFFSFLVSYLRARAGGLRIDCEIGIFTRPERLVVLIIGLLVSQVTITLVLLAVVTFITVIQRMWLVFTEAEKLDKK